MSPLSGLVIAYNEEKHIRDCLISLYRVCDDIVVIDSNSEDKTVEIARELGATVVIQPFLGDGPQRSAGLPHCKHPWVFYLDADERLDEDLVTELKTLDFENQSAEAYECRRKNHIDGRWIKVAGQYPDYICRLFDRTKTDFSPLQTHARIITSKLGRLSGHIVHYAIENLNDMSKRMVRYSDWQSQSMFEEGKKVSKFAPIGHGIGCFIKFYLLRRGFMAGLDGLNLSIFNAMGSYLKYAKLLEKQNSSRRASI
ncbi:MAG: glycosyltransferase family 2 protein [bacterium]